MPALSRSPQGSPRGLGLESGEHISALLIWSRVYTTPRYDSYIPVENNEYKYAMRWGENPDTQRFKTIQLQAESNQPSIHKMSFPYKHVLLVGATAGIGRALADRFVETGIKVTAVGRRQERLDEFVSKHGEDKANSAVFDIGDIAKIPEFAKRYV